jgi:hypothetical protein
MDKVNLADKLSLFSKLWSPKIVGELNGQQVKDDEVHLLLLEPASTLDTGNLQNSRTVESPEYL